MEKFKMDATKKKEWVKALKSGKYKQGRGTLCEESSPGNLSFCCLGVLASLQGLETRRMQEYQWDELLVGEMREYCCDIPLPIQKELANMNDGQTGRGENFAEIADWIEKEL